MAILKFVCSFVRADSAVWKGADNRIELAAYAFQVMGLDMHTYVQQSLVHDSVSTLSVEESDGWQFMTDLVSARIQKSQEAHAEFFAALDAVGGVQHVDFNLIDAMPSDGQDEQLASYRRLADAQRERFKDGRRKAYKSDLKSDRFSSGS